MGERREHMSKQKSEWLNSADNDTNNDSDGKGNDRDLDIRKQGRIHGIRCVLACTDSNFGQKGHYCMVSTPV